MKLNSALTSFIVLSLGLSLFGCKGSISKAENEPFVNDLATMVSDKVVVKNNLPEKIKFTKANNSETFFLKPKENGLKLEGIEGEAISNLTLDIHGKIQIETTTGLILGHVLSRDNYWKLEDAEQTQALYALSQEPDGDYSLKSPDNQEIYRVESRDYGFEVKNAQDKSVYTIKVKDNKAVLQDTNEHTVLETTSEFPLLAVACYGFDVLDQSQQTALAYAVSLMKQ
jgi:hypothetical protein